MNTAPQSKFEVSTTIMLLLLCIGVSNTKAQTLIDFETGFVSTGYNNVRIPGNLGTLFSLKDDLIPKTEFFYRIRLNYTIKSRHTLSLLYAPLETKSEGIYSQSKQIVECNDIVEYYTNGKIYRKYKLCLEGVIDSLYVYKKMEIFL